MTRLVKMGGWSGSAGTVILSARSHTVPMLVTVAAALLLVGISVFVWILSSDRRAERMNLLLRGGTLPAPDKSVAPAELEEAGASEPARAAPPPPEVDSSIDPQITHYIARLRSTDRLELADTVESRLRAAGTKPDEELASESEAPRNRRPGEHYA